MLRERLDSNSALLTKNTLFHQGGFHLGVFFHSCSTYWRYSGGPADVTPQQASNYLMFTAAPQLALMLKYGALRTALRGPARETGRRPKLEYENQRRKPSLPPPSKSISPLWPRRFSTRESRLLKVSYIHNYKDLRWSTEESRRWGFTPSPDAHNECRTSSMQPLCALESRARRVFAFVSLLGSFRELRSALEPSL